MIRRIECFGAKLQFQFFGEREVLKTDEINNHCARIAKLADRARRVAKRVQRRIHKRCRIEPLHAAVWISIGESARQIQTANPVRTIRQTVVCASDR